MPGYQVRFDTVTVGATDYTIRSLLDRQQYCDPLGEAEQAGMSASSWSLFGQVWPSARVLAQIMDTYELGGLRILEVGAGIALASLVAHHRAGNMTVSDWHPLCQSFLDANLLLNHLGPMKYAAGNWAGDNPELGLFDLIIGSDLLYERQQPGQLAAFIHRHAAASAHVIIVDPDRGNRVSFCREMTGLGFVFTSRRAASALENGEAYKGCILDFARAA